MARKLTGNGTLDPRHDWASSRRAFNGGRNDGFVQVNAGSNQDETMGYYTREQLPFLHALAGEYTVCDRWFSSVMGPTWPNRFYLHAGTATGKRTNVPMGCRRHRRSGSGWLTGAGPGRTTIRARSPGIRSRSRPTASRATTRWSRSQLIISIVTPPPVGCRTSRSSIPTSLSTTATRPTTWVYARRSSPASTDRWPRARSGRARCW